MWCGSGASKKHLSFYSSTQRCFDSLLFGKFQPLEVLEVSDSVPCWFAIIITYLRSMQ